MSASEEKKAQIIALWQQGLHSPEIAQQLGMETMVVAGYVAAWKRKQADHDIEEADAIQTKFGLERDLQLALRANIQQLEHGLKVTDGGKEQAVASGRIDITAEDTTGSTVVIELKAGPADRETVGQILGYMGDLQPHSKKPIRGIIVAGDFNSAAVSALGALPNLQLKQYSFQFSFASVHQEKK